MKITIRHLNPEDSEAVHKIFLSEKVIWGTMRLPYDSFENTQRRLESGKGTIRLVAELLGEVVGFAELITYPNLPRHRHVGEINLIAVRDDQHGKGIGRALMQAVVNLAEQWLQITKLNLLVWEDNEKAIQLYQQFGFVVEGTITEYAFRQGEYVNAHVMGRAHSKKNQKRQVQQDVQTEMLVNGLAKAGHSYTLFADK